MFNKLIATIGILILTGTSYTLGQSSKDKKLELTDSEKILVLTSQLDVCRQQARIQDLNSTLRNLVSKVEEAHPGYTLDFNTGQLVVKKAESGKN